MKRAAMTLFLVGWANAVCGQGTVTFQNNGSIFGDVRPVDRLVYFGEVGGEKLIGTNYAAALYYTLPGLTDLILAPGAIRLFRLPTTTLPGTWNTQPTASVTLPGVFIGAFTTLQVRVWDIQQFETWEAAIIGEGLHGESNSFVYWPPPLGGASDSTLQGLRAFAVIPEPSVFGLGLLGAGVWWLLRRCKKIATVCSASDREPSRLAARRHRKRRGHSPSLPPTPAAATGDRPWSG